MGSSPNGSVCDCRSYQSESWTDASPLQSTHHILLLLFTDRELTGVFLGLYITPQAKGEVEKAIYHFEIALRTTSSSNRRDGLHSIYFDLAGRFLGEGGLDRTRAHAEYLKSRALNRPYSPGLVVNLQAWLCTPSLLLVPVRLGPGGYGLFRVLPCPRMSLGTVTGRIPDKCSVKSDADQQTSLFSTSTFGIAFCNRWGAHVHPTSRNFWPEWTRRSIPCLRTTGGARRPYDVEPPLTSL